MATFSIRTIVICAAATAGACLWAGASTGAPLETRQIAPDFRLEKIADNVYAFVSNNTTHLWEDGNTTVIIGDNAVAIVDAPTTYLSRRHLAEIRKLTDKPIRYVINTHFHRDHLMGNHVYKDAFPDALIVQQDYTAEMADRRDPSIMEKVFKQGESADLLKSLKNAAETGRDSDGKPLTGYDLERARRSYAEFLPVYREAQGARYVPADLTYDSTMTIKLGSTELKLMHMEGHTRGDTVVWLPREKVLITGDLITGPVPFGFAGLYVEWIDSLEKLMAMKAAAIVPGHGEVEFNNDFMELESALFRGLMAQADSAVAAHESLEEFKKKLDLSQFESRMVHGDPELKWGWDNYFIDGAADRAFAIAHGDL